MRMRRGAAA